MKERELLRMRDERAKEKRKGKAGQNTYKHPEIWTFVNQYWETDPSMPSTNLGCGTKSGCSRPANTIKHDGDEEGIRREGERGREYRNIPLQPSSFLEIASTNLQEQSGQTHSVPHIVRRTFSYSPLRTT